MGCNSCQNGHFSAAKLQMAKVGNYARTFYHFWFFGYAEIKPIILGAKYDKQFAHLRHTAQFCAVIFKNDALLSQIDVITFVPSSRSRIARRGYDQAEMIARSFGKVLRKPVHSTLSQSYEFQQTLSRKSDRMLKPNYVISAKVRYRNYLLIDDIATTRTSLLKSADSLIKSGAKNVSLLTLGH